MILFAFLLPIMLGFLALSVDIGRIRVARTQTEGAADAAAVAALVELRDGGSEGFARTVADGVANDWRLQRVRASSASTEFDVDVDFGTWDWETRTYSPGSGRNAVTVNLTQTEPLGLMFAPVFGLGGSDEAGIFGGGPYARSGANTGSSKTIRVGRRAAMRPRDIVFVVDISREMQPHIDDLHNAMEDFVDTLDDFGVQDDRIATVVFAGDAVLHQDFEFVDTSSVAIDGAIDDINPCLIDEAAWYHWYRFMDPQFDRELDPSYADWADPNDIPFVFNYRAVYRDTSGLGGAHFYWGPNALSFRPQERDPSWISYEAFQFNNAIYDPGDDIAADFSNWEDPIPNDSLQCSAWSLSYIYFMYCDPRRGVDPEGFLCSPIPGFEQYSGGPAGNDLTCHDGNYWEGDGSRWNEFPEFAVPEVDCTADPYAPVIDGPPYMANVDPFGDGLEYPDMSYTMAGTNPGSGLDIALDLLDDLQPSRAEPTVILISAAGAKCGPNFSSTTRTACNEEYQLETWGAASDLEDFGANTHVIGITTDLSEDDIYLSGLTTGRGQYLSTEDSAGLTDLLDVVARDIRLQVVE